MVPVSTRKHTNGSILEREAKLKFSSDENAEQFKNKTCLRQKCGK